MSPLKAWTASHTVFSVTFCRCPSSGVILATEKLCLGCHKTPSNNRIFQQILQKPNLLNPKNHNNRPSTPKNNALATHPSSSHHPTRPAQRLNATGMMEPRTPRTRLRRSFRRPHARRRSFGRPKKEEETTRPEKGPRMVGYSSAFSRCDSSGPHITVCLSEPSRFFSLFLMEELLRGKHLRS